MDLLAPSVQTEHLATMLQWCIVGALGYYALRVAAALALLGLAAIVPGCRRAALAAAPGTLRPVLQRVLAGGLLGVALSGATAAAAEPCAPQVSGVPVLDRAERCAASMGDPSAGPAPSGPRGEPPATAAAPAPAPDAARHYVVRPGDSLWRISAGLLGPRATQADIAAAWPQLWQANRAAIGPDPGLIVPGAVLTVPADGFDQEDR